MKTLLLSLFCFFSLTVGAQSLKATVKEHFDVQKLYSTVHTFAIGDTVRIHGYKKKGDKLYFVVETHDYADRISCNANHFDIEEKKLKKLPNALGAGMEPLVKDLQLAVEARKKADVKKKALEGQLRVTLDTYRTFTSKSGAIGNPKRGDVVSLVGYKSAYMGHEYALYSETAAGVFECSSNIGLFTKDIDLKYLPSVDDHDVQQLLEGKKKVLRQQIAEKRQQYRNKALKGDVKGILAYSYFSSDDYKESPFSSGDTVCVVGYSNSSSKHSYALCSKEAAGVFSSYNSPGLAFKNSKDISFSELPSATDPEVTHVLAERKALADSLMRIKVEQMEKELAETKTRLISIFRDNAPIIVHVESWSSNSVGGIEVSLSVTNCSTQIIKYVTFQGYFTNAVGDKCRNEIGGGTVWKGRGIGPIGPRPTSLDDFEERIDDCKGSYTFDNLTFYSRIADAFHLSSVTIQYMSGKTVTISGANLNKHVRY